MNPIDIDFETDLVDGADHMDGAIGDECDTVAPAPTATAPVTSRSKTFFIGGALLLVGCVSHIAPYQAKHRKFDPGEYGAEAQLENGSLYSAHKRGLFEDTLAHGLGDIVIIRIDETDSASRDGQTKLTRKSDTEAGVSNSFGLLAALPASVNPATLLGATTKNDFEGTGKVERQGKLDATLPVRVKHIMPNGDLFVEGTKVILVNEEEHHLYVSGIIRPSDIGPDDVVPSSRVADAEIEYAGRGVVSDTQRQGWLSHLFNILWPF